MKTPTFSTKFWRILLYFLAFSLSLAACNNGPTASAQSNEETLAVALIELQSTLDVALAATEEPTSPPPATPTEAVAFTATPNTAVEPTKTVLPSATGTVVPTATTSSWYYVDPELPTATPTVGISLSSTSISRGESFTVSVVGFTAYVNIDLWLYEVDSDTKTIYDGVTDSTGAYSVTMVMPTTASEGEYWAVYVHTTDLDGMESATSSTITIASDTSDATVSVSSTSVDAGETFTVTATGFPAYSNVDFKLSNEDSSSILYVDGYTDSTGACAVTMTMPATADDDEEWAVKVYTTDLETQTIAYSSTITSSVVDATATPTSAPTATATTAPTATTEPTTAPTATEEVIIIPTNTPTPVPTATEESSE